VKLAQDIEVDIQLSDIDRARPVGKENKQLIVKFTNYSARYRFFSIRRKLKNKVPNVYINEDLTAHRAKLFSRLLDLRKRKIVENAWTMDGRLFLWLWGQKRLILTASDIDNISR
jgi:hypothetical protein